MTSALRILCIVRRRRYALKSGDQDGIWRTARRGHRRRDHQAHRATLMGPPDKAKDRLNGRALTIGPHDTVLRRHRAWMSSRQAIDASKLRKQLVEPVFGIIKEQQAARRFLLRGLVNVTAEWTVLATAFNLRTLWRVWRSHALSLLPHGPAPQPVS